MRVDTRIDGVSSATTYDEDMTKIRHIYTIKDGALEKSRAPEDHCSCDLIYEASYHDENTPNVNIVFIRL